MTSEAIQVHLAPLDEKRFGIQSARALIATADALPSVLEFCRSNGVSFLAIRCPTSEIRLAQTLEREGFALMDTLVYFVRDLRKAPIPPDTGQVPVRAIRPGEEDTVRGVAADAFRGYYGHYHADERLDPAKCDEVYTDWAYRSCVDRDVADHVLLAELDGVIVGFATLQINSPEEGEGVLFAVHPSAQRRGIYRSFTVNAMNWCADQGAQRMVVSTQVNNVAVQKAWARLGFEPQRSYYTFHKWFDAERNAGERP